MKPKLLVIGHAGHGKDTVCEILHLLYDLKFQSSSYFVAEKAVRPYLAIKGLEYNTLEDCYADRINHRALWHDAIAEYNKDDPAKLGMELFAQYDVYCGLRSKIEYEHLKLRNAFDCVWWIDGQIRVEPESASSMKLTLDDADFYINNNGNKEFLCLDIIRTWKLTKDFINRR